MKLNLKLDKIADFKNKNRTVLFVIMDGFGLRTETQGNCVYLAKKPNIDSMIEWAKGHNLYTQLKAHGSAVGLPSDEDQGNSEVGHNALGAGRVFSQGAKLVNQAIKDRSIFKTSLWKNLIHITEKNSIHLIGLLSDGNVHSHIHQLFGLLDELARIKIKNVRIHVLLDGRDVQPRSALEYVDALEDKLVKLTNKFGVDFRIASGGGRMRVTMDRYESDWNVVKRGWDAHVRGVPEKSTDYKGYFKSAREAITEARKLEPNVSDQYLPSFVVIDENNKPIGPIADGDKVINFNFRGDRAIQISKAFEYKNFEMFDRIVYPKVEYFGMLEYDGDLGLPKQFLVSPPKIDKTIGQYLCAERITQYACAETHKFGHLTYFWNGNNSGYIDESLEEYVEIKSEPSEMIATHPEMRTKEVCKSVIDALKSKRFKFIRVNLANPDMVGHTGIIKAGIRAVETVDRSLGLLKDAITKNNGIMVVSADHGNIEELEGENRTSHTTNPVPFFIWDPLYKNDYVIREDLEVPQIGNITAALINLIGFEKPEEYLDSLIKFK